MPLNFGQWDNLIYDYSGNQLTKVTDSAPNSHKDFGFKDGSNPGDDYVYDVNGNMIQDLNKGIFDIKYNHLNLPVEINFDEHSVIPSIKYVYDATGVKLAKNVMNEGTISTLYAGGFIYNNAAGSQKLQFLSHPEGYVEPVAGLEWSV